MKITEAQLRGLVREFLGIDAAYAAEIPASSRKAVENFKGTAPDIPTKQGVIFQTTAKIKDASYYTCINGQISLGDTSVPQNKLALSVIETFKQALSDATAKYFVYGAGGEFPEIDTSDINDVRKELLNYASRIEMSPSVTMKSVFKLALKYTNNDKAVAAAICYEAQRALPHVVGVSLFTAGNKKYDKSAYDRFQSVKKTPSALTVYITEVPEINESEGDKDVAVCVGDYPVGDISSVFGGRKLCSQSVVFLNGEEKPDYQVIIHEIGHAIANCINSAFSEILSTSDKEAGKEKSSAAYDKDYTKEANIDIIAKISPPALPGGDFNKVSAPTSSAKPYLTQAIDFIKANTKLETGSPASFAKVGFKALGIVNNRDYSGVGGLYADENGKALQSPDGYDPAGTKVVFGISSTGWTFLPDEIRNSVLNIFRLHRRARKEFKDQYTSAKDVRPFIVKYISTISDNFTNLGEDILTMALLAALGPRTAADFEVLNAVAALDKQDKDGDDTTLAESALRNLIRHHVLEQNSRKRFFL